MVTSTSPSKEDLIDDLYRLPDHMKAEIINRAIVPMSPTSGKPSRGSFSPDASYCVGQVIDQDFVNDAPIFAAEIRSKNDYGAKAERQILAKIADYFAAGTRVVWDVDVLR